MADRITEHADGYDVEPDEGATILDDLCAAFTKFVAFPSPEAADAVALWTAATHGQPAWEHAPRLILTSPEKRCGKSRLLDLAARTCHDALVTVNVSAAALVRSITNDPPTLLLDEADTVFGTKTKAEQNEHLRGILNAGHQRGRPYIRWDANARRTESCVTFAMALLAGIGDLPETIADRGITIHMRRRAPGEHVAPYRTRRDAPTLHKLRDRLDGWVRNHLDELAKAEPEMPLEDRAADTWEPLCAVADLAGGDWPARARRAAVVLTEAEATSADSLGVRLLTDIRTVFDSAGVDRMATGALLNALHKLPESSWREFRGKPLDDRGLAWRLRPYGVKPKTIRVADATPRGYERADFADAWDRYTPSDRNKRNERNSAGQHVADVADVADAETERNALTRDVALVADVALTPYGAAQRNGHDGHAVPFQWQYAPAPIGSCVHCHTVTSSRGPDGRPWHPLCHEEVHP